MDLNEARRIAVETIREHLDPRWTFAWNNSVSSLGHCNFKLRRIVLSRAMTQAGTEDQVRDTILHEVAHALAGFQAGHGREWKIIAMRLGAVPRATTLDAPNLRQQSAPWVGTCPAGHVSPTRFWRKPRNRRSCGICCPNVYNADHILTFRRVDTMAGVR